MHFLFLCLPTEFIPWYSHDMMGLLYPLFVICTNLWLMCPGADISADTQCLVLLILKVKHPHESTTSWLFSSASNYNPQSQATYGKIRNMQLLKNSDKCDLNGLAVLQKPWQKATFIYFHCDTFCFLQVCLLSLANFATNYIEGKKESPESVAFISTLSGFCPRGKSCSKLSKARAPKKCYVIIYFKNLTQCTDNPKLNIMS